MTAPVTLPDLLRQAAAAGPELVAIAVQGHRGLTYGDWEKRSSAMARGLQRAGVRCGDRVALPSDLSGWSEHAVAYLAVHKAGAVAVPLVRGLGAVELDRMVGDLLPSAIVAAPGLASAGGSVPIIDPGELEDQDDGVSPAHRADPSDLGEILCVSHPLSRPVYVSRSHRDLLAGPSLTFGAPAGSPSLLHAFPAGTLPGQDALCAALQPTPMRSVVLADVDPDRLCRMLAARATRTCGLHPAIAQALIDTGATARHDLCGVRGLVLASGRVPPALLVHLTAAFPRAVLRLVDVLGHPPGLRTVFAHDRSRPGSLGRPVDGSAVTVTDESGRAVGRGEVGRVGVRGRRVTAVKDEQAEEPTPLQDTVGGEDLAPAPVAFSQEGMLWHELFAPGCQNLPGLARRFRGPLDVAALGRALDEIVRRHETLRTTFELRGGHPVQVVHAHRPLDLAVRDLSGLAPSELEAHVDRLVAEAGRAPFDLVAGPLFEPALLRLADDDHVLVIRTHHSVFDDWSVGVFRRELAALYTAYAQGEDSPLPELAQQFAQLCRRQRRELAGPAGTRELDFWRGELAGAPLITQLPVHDPELPEGAPQATGRPVALTLPPEVCDRLRMLARRERVTVFMTLLAAFGVLVRHQTGQDDLVLATVVANRNRTELEGPIGCFTKKVPLRLRLDGDPTFADVLRRARAALLGALSHQDLPFETVIGDVLGAPAAAHGVVPHLAVMFQGVAPARELVLPDVESSGLETSSTAPRAHFMARGYDAAGHDVPAVPWGGGLYLGTFVILSVADSGGELSCIARGAFHAPAVRELMDGFAALLGEVTADPARHLSDLAVVDGSPAKQTGDVGARGAASGHVDLRGFGVDLARMRSAVAGCPGVRDVAVTLERGEPAIVATVVPDGRPPTLTDLRTFLWARLPGYAWPSALVVVERLPPERDDEAEPSETRRDRAVTGAGATPFTVDESLLGTLWGEVLGVERIAPTASYSQVFSFTQALARARDAGVPFPGELVTRNRTVETLAAAMAARRHAPEP